MELPFMYIPTLYDYTILWCITNQPVFMYNTYWKIIHFFGVQPTIQFSLTILYTSIKEH